MIAASPRRILVDVGWLAGLRVIGAVLSVVSAVVLTRALGPVGFGHLSFALVVTATVQMLASTWSSAATLRFGREEYEGTGGVARTSRSRIRLMLPATAGLTAAASAFWALGGLPTWFGLTLVTLTLAYGVMGCALDHTVYLRQARGAQLDAAVAVLLQQVLIVVVVAIVLLAGGDLSPELVLVFYVAGTSVLMLQGVVALRHVLAIGDTAPGPDPRVWAFSRPMIGFTAATYVLMSVDLIVLGAFATAAEVGTYAVAYRIYSILFVILGSISTILMPTLVSRRVQGRDEATFAAIRSIFPALMSVPLGATLIAAPLAYVLVPVVFGDAYASARGPLVVLVVATGVMFVASTLGTVLTAYDRAGVVARAAGLSAVCNIVLDLLLVGLLDQGGTAVACATLVSCLVYTEVYRREVDAVLGGGLGRPGAGGAVALAGVGGCAALASAAPELGGIVTACYGVGLMLIGLRGSPALGILLSHEVQDGGGGASGEHGDGDA